PPFWEKFEKAARQYASELQAYSTEVQQIWQSPVHTLIVGSRFQTGTAETRSEVTAPEAVNPDLEVRQQNTVDLERFNVYGYYSWQVLERLQLFGGLSYDRLRFPVNIVYGTIADGERVKDQVSPKAGFIWAMMTNSILRGSYTRSLGGIYYDQSVRLEPSQVA